MKILASVLQVLETSSGTYELELNFSIFATCPNGFFSNERWTT